jgi:class 3 adenylate cyclase/tetratricopeptide (TPR) repeat protein
LAEHTSAAPRFTTPEAYTPKHLAERILLTRAALEGERKQVTVLFADLKGSMELLADRDPEEAQKILDAVLERMIGAVHRYEGTVNQVMGDGIMALFGAPVAHEDHAARACYAALRMQDSVKRYAEEARQAHGVNVRIRVGLNSGDVVVRAIGSDLRMDYTAVGQTTHLAARMEQLALPGTIVVTPATRDLVEGLLAVSSLGPMPVKGLTEPLEVFEVTGVGAARTRLHAAARRGLTRFVGRDSELEQLWRVQELAAKGRGQVAAVVGEAGVGKSRLVYEFTHSHRLQGWLVLEAASVSYGKATSYLPVIALLKSYFKIQDRDDQREVREKVTGKLLALDRTLEPTLSALLSLLDVPVEDPTWQTAVPEQRRRQTLDGVKRLLLREAREQPLVVVFEDLHWIDGETQALLDGLVESLGSARILLLVDYRPEYQHGWSRKTYYCQLRLDALPPASAADLLDALLGEDRGLAPLKQLLIKRGNPFFVEETVRTLVETGALAGEQGQYRLVQAIGAIQIPPTVQSMLAARIDRLPPDTKRLLQVASAVGRDVPFVLLHEIAEASEEQLRALLAQLQTAEFLHETALFPDLEYSFKHALTHEVTYGSLLLERRRELHARIVKAIEKHHVDRLTEHIERLAYHAHRGEMGEKAVGYLRQAGLKAAGRLALDEARTWLQHALDVLEAVPESRSSLEQGYEIRLELRPVLNQLGEGTLASVRLHEAMSLAEKLGDELRQGRIKAFMTNEYVHLGKLNHALESGQRALEIAGKLGDLRLRILATSYSNFAHYCRGDYDVAVDLALENLAALPPEWVATSLGYAARPSVVDRWLLVKSLAALGRFAEATSQGVEGIRIAESTQHPYSISMAYLAAGHLYLSKGEWANACEFMEHGVEVAQAASILNLLTLGLAECSWALARVDQPRIALMRVRDAEDRIQQQARVGSVSSGVWAYHSLGRACLQLGDLDEATRFAQQAVEWSSKFGHQGTSA